MTTEENKSLIRRYYDDMWNQWNFALADRLIADDISFRGSLGIDVHDCSQARKEMYLDAELRPGMVFTIEPGLYFRAEDELAPPQLRGIGVRIEDNVLVTEDGCENLSVHLPRQPVEIEAWMASLAPDSR